MYTVAAFAVNLGVIIYMCINAAKYSEHSADMLASASTMLINIPIALFYLWIVSTGLQLMHP